MKDFRIVTYVLLVLGGFVLGVLFNTYNPDFKSFFSNKIGPQSFELLEFKSGYDLTGATLQPEVKLTIKNISGSAITEEVKIEVVFIDDNTKEEISRVFFYLVKNGSPPMEESFSKEHMFNSEKPLDINYNNINYSDPFAIIEHEIIAKIYINNEFFKTINIEKKHLYEY